MLIVSKLKYFEDTVKELNRQKAEAASHGDTSDNASYEALNVEIQKYHDLILRFHEWQEKVFIPNGGPELLGKYIELDNINGKIVKLKIVDGYCRISQGFFDIYTELGEKIILAKSLTGTIEISSALSIKFKITGT